MSHTPAPWHVGGATKYLNQVQIEPAIGCVYGAGEEIKANARLISQAPAMLEALERLLACYSVSHSPAVRESVWQQSRAAITAAKGEA